MDYFMRFSLVAVLCFALTGCDAGRSSALVAEIEKLKAENVSLQQANRQLEEKLIQTKEKLAEANQDLAKITAITGDLGAGKDMLFGLAEKYGEYLKIAKDLGLPELNENDSTIEDLLKTLGQAPAEPSEEDESSE